MYSVGFRRPGIDRHSYGNPPPDKLLCHWNVQSQFKIYCHLKDWISSYFEVGAIWAQNLGPLVTPRPVRLEPLRSVRLLVTSDRADDDWPSTCTACYGSASDDDIYLLTMHVMTMYACDDHDCDDHLCRVITIMHVINIASDNDAGNVISK